MFAPVGYTPLSFLWDGFIDASLTAFCAHAVRYYMSDGFWPYTLRGGPLDIAEHVFTSKMSDLGVFAANSDGGVMRIHSRGSTGALHLFSQIDPYTSALCAAATEVEYGNLDKVDRIAGKKFEAWEFEPNEGDQWIKYYEPLVSISGSVPSDLTLQLRFHSLPVSYERGRFLIAEKLPDWAPVNADNRNQEVIVKHFGGRALCVADSSLDRWSDVLSGKDLDLDGDESSIKGDVSQVGRPSKIPSVIEAYKTVFPSGHMCSWKQALKKVNVELVDPVSEQTLRRAIDQMKST